MDRKNALIFALFLVAAIVLAALAEGCALNIGSGSSHVEAHRQLDADLDLDEE